MYIVMFYIDTVITGPSALTVNIMKNIESSSIVLQWDAVDDSLPTTYTIIWTDEGDLFEAATLTEQTSYTITGLTLDTVYTITVSPANICGNGPEFSTNIPFSTDTTSTTTSISPTVTAGTIKTPHATTVSTTVIKSFLVIPTVSTYPSTTNIVDCRMPTTNPADKIETSKFSNTTN